MSRILQINLTGQNDIANVGKLLQALSRLRVHLLDITQTVIYESLFLAMIMEIPDEDHVEPTLNDLRIQASSLGLRLETRRLSVAEYEDWVSSQQKKRCIITLLGRSLTAEHLAKVNELVQEYELEINFIQRLSNRKPSHQTQPNPGLTCIEIALRGAPVDISEMRTTLLSVSQNFGIDIGIQEDTPYRKHRRLLALDMDSTLIQTEVVDELAEYAGVREEVARITEEAMQGRIDFRESLRQRVELLEGLSVDRLEEVTQKLRITDGAQRLIQNLKTLGYKVAIISGGFTFFGKRLQQMLGIDYLYANDLEIENGRLTGRIKGEVVDGEKKAELLSALAEREGISLEQVIAVGDGANDLPMLNLVGLGIAFRPKPIVRQGAKQAISNVGLDAILYFLGLRDREAIV
jgi:phosphoserine phosphatase